MRPLWEHEACANPMFLSLALKQLISHGSYMTLQSYRDKLLLASSVPQLVTIIITDLQASTFVGGIHRPDIIASIFQLIYCSREGLTGSEIVDVIAMRQKQEANRINIPFLTQESFMHLVFGLRQLIVSKRGILNFVHDFVRQAVESLFFCGGSNFAQLEADLIGLSSTATVDVNSLLKAKNVLTAAQGRKTDLHRSLAAFFQIRADIDNSTLTHFAKYPRSMRELTFHQRKANIRPAVVVATRVRPFNQAEKLKHDREDKVYVMKGKQVMLTDPETKKSTVFGLDFALDSNCSKININYAGQDRVFSLCGADVVLQTLDGYNSTILAFGQTGSGKSYTMFGTPQDPGIINLTMTELIKQLNLKKKRDKISWTASCTMIEVYLNQLKDLLVDADDTPEARDHSRWSSRYLCWHNENLLQNRRVRYLKVYYESKEEHIQISQVAVYSNGVNVALHKPTSSYADYSGSKPSTAVDGALTPRAYPHIYHSQNSKDEFWCVDLEDEFHIEKVVYYNRAECCAERSKGMIFELFAADRTSVWKGLLPHGGLAEESLDFTLASCDVLDEWLVTLPDSRCGYVDVRDKNNTLLRLASRVEGTDTVTITTVANNVVVGTKKEFPLPEILPLQFRISALKEGFDISCVDASGIVSHLLMYEHELPVSFPVRTVATKGWHVTSCLPAKSPVRRSPNVEILVDATLKMQGLTGTKSAQFLRVSPVAGNQRLSLSQVAVFTVDDVNVALNQPARDNSPAGSSKSGLLVDGTMIPRPLKDCYQSQASREVAGKGDFWEVDLCQEFNVNKIVLVAPVDCSTAGYILELFSTSHELCWTGSSAKTSRGGLCTVLIDKRTPSFPITLKNATSCSVDNVEDMLRIIKVGERLRHTASTDMNDVSSRSHCVFTLSVTQKLPHSTITSKINLVDLAGNERGSKAGFKTPLLMREAIATNSSLSALNNCMRALTNPSAEFIPYRDSKLTWMLQDR
jgi:hypothetical protein